jgi:hypothetical protein
MSTYKTTRRNIVEESDFKRNNVFFKMVLAVLHAALISLFADANIRNILEI